MFLSLRVSDVRTYLSPTHYPLLRLPLLYTPPKTYPNPSKLTPHPQACIAIINGRASIFSSLPWRTLPFATRPAPHPPFHHLMDILLLTTKALVLSSEHQIPLCDLLVALPTFDQPSRDLCEARCLELLGRLERWWVDFECCGDEDVCGFGGGAYGPTKSIYTSTHTAFITSVYCACALILHSTLHGLTTLSPLNASHTTQAQKHLSHAISHAHTILLLSTYQQANCHVGFNLIRSTFALKVVENMGPGEELREKAARMSLGWEERGLVGILAADCEFFFLPFVLFSFLFWGGCGRRGVRV